jgi:hypothetical protein
MNQYKYKLILSVSISHSYFQKKIDPSLRFQPSISTIDLMNRFKIIVRQTSFGIEIYCDTEESVESILMTIIASTEISSLDFDFYTDDLSFYSYTELPDRVGQLVFSSDNKLNRNENENIFLYPSFIEGQNEKRLGQLHIQLVDLMKFCNTNNHVNFNISFNSRSTHWQYYIINSSKFSLNEMSIVSNSGIKFSIPKKIVLQNGQDATLFTSETLIPLSNLPEHKFDLKKSGKTIISGLPNPNIGSLTLDKSNGEILFYSPTYIYI